VQPSGPTDLLEDWSQASYALQLMVYPPVHTPVLTHDKDNKSNVTRSYATLRQGVSNQFALTSGAEDYDWPQPPQWGGGGRHRASAAAMGGGRSGRGAGVDVGTQPPQWVGGGRHGRADKYNIVRVLMQDIAGNIET
jgi:hypothetical protein